MEESNFYDLCRQLILLTVKTIQPQLHELGLYPGQEIFLSVLSKHEGITLIELSSLVKRERSTITKAVQSLENGGFVKRIPSTVDKRKYHLYLTEKGKQTALEIEKLGKQVLKKYNSLMDEEEKQVVERILNRVSTQLKKEGI